MKLELESLNKSFSENIETSNVARENMNDMIAQRKQIENELEMLDNHMFAKDEDLRKMQEQLRIAVEGVEDQSEDKDNEIRMLVATLHEKDAELAELHGRAEALSNTLHEKDTALDELHGRAEALYNTLNEKDRALEEKNTALKELHGRVEELSNTLNEKNTELADSSRSSQRVDELSILLQNLTEQKDTELQDKTSDLREKDTELQEKTFDLREKDAALREKDDDLRVKDTEIQDKDTALREKGVEVREKDAALREKDAALREKDAELKDKNEEIMKCSLRIQEVSAALQEQSEKDEERYHEKESIIQQKRELNLRLNEAEKANTDIINMTFKEKNNLETKNKDFQQFVSDLKKENRRMSEDMARMSHDLEMSESVLKRSNDEMQTKLYSTNVHRENAESEVSTWSERASELDKRNIQLCQGRDELIRKNVDLEGIASERRRLDQELFEQRERLETERREHESQRCDLESTIASLAAKVDKAESECMASREERVVIDNMKRDLEAERIRRENLNQTLGQTEEDNRKLETKIRFLTEDMLKM